MNLEQVSDPARTVTIHIQTNSLVSYLRVISSFFFLRCIAFFTSIATIALTPSICSPYLVLLMIILASWTSHMIIHLFSPNPESQPRKFLFDLAVFQHLQEFFNNQGIKMFPGLILNMLQGLFSRPGFAVGPV